MNRKLSLPAALFVILGAAACSSNPSSPVAPSAAAVGSADAALDARRSAEPTIVGIATSNPAFSTLVAAVQKAGLVETLNGSKHYTVFAPTNGAFNDAGTALNDALGLGLVDDDGNGLGDELVDALPVQDLTAILLYHVTNGDRNSTSVLAAGQLRMLDGNQAVVQGTSIAGAPFVLDLLDRRASNGIVHVISGVMVPPGLL